ncbi:MAG: acylphosphatase, partial [Planctomycetaceae bacterium]|nr:acylphosphatase [Planctomycetaceae bacterium]
MNGLSQPVLTWKKSRLNYKRNKHLRPMPPDYWRVVSWMKTTLKTRPKPQKKSRVSRTGWSRSTRNSPVGRFSNRLTLSRKKASIRNWWTSCSIMSKLINSILPYSIAASASEMSQLTQLTVSDHSLRSNPAMPMRYIFHGHVQGVGFRYTTRQIARRFPVTG